MIKYIILYLVMVFVSSVSQVMLKKAALREYESTLKSYLNPLVIIAYGLFFLTTLTGVLCYKHIPVSYGPILEATGYFYVTFWGVTIFGEKINSKKVLALILIVIGIVIYTSGGKPSMSDIAIEPNAVENTEVEVNPQPEIGQQVQQPQEQMNQQEQQPQEQQESGNESQGAGLKEDQMTPLDKELIEAGATIPPMGNIDIDIPSPKSIN